MRMLKQAQQQEQSKGLHAGVIVVADIVIVTIVTIVTILSVSVSGGRTRIKNNIPIRKK